MNRRTDRRILKMSLPVLPGFRIQSKILTDFRILQLQRIADSFIIHFLGPDFGFCVKQKNIFRISDSGRNFKGGFD